MITSKKIKAIIFLVLTVVWICVIFNFSLQSAETSSNVSRGLLVKVLNFIYDITNIRIEPTLVHNLFRKFAHFTEFFILGIFSVSFFKSINKRPFYSIILGMCVAITDETIQFFTGEGRAKRVTDMLIDTSGVIFATLVFYIFWKLFFYKKKKENLK